MAHSKETIVTPTSATDPTLTLPPVSVTCSLVVSVWYVCVCECPEHVSLNALLFPGDHAHHPFCERVDIVSTTLLTNHSVDPETRKGTNVHATDLSIPFLTSDSKVRRQRSTSRLHRLTD